MAQQFSTFKVRCSSCNAWIWWAETPLGKRIPVDEHPVEDGNIYQTAPGKVAFLHKGETPPEGAELYKSHFATCKHAASHRKAKVGR